MNIQDLHTPFPAAEIEWRVGSTNGDKTSGLALAYLTARHVMERLDAVCGPENWQDRYEFHGARTVCYLSLRIGDEWVTKADGAGDSDVEAEKGAISDALKRAAVKWGIGRYLYDLGNVWVDVEPAGRSVRIKKNQYAKLQAELNNRFGPSLKAVEPVSQPEPVPDDGLALYTRLSQANKKCATKADFSALWGNPKTITAQASLSEGYQDDLEAEKIKKFSQLEANEPSDYIPPTFPEPTA
jgi:hypothetical protein